MNSFWEKALGVAREASAEVGEELLRLFGRVTATEKEDGTLITQGDRWADQRLRERIASAFPDHGILSEEADCTFPDREWTWVIDPVDGTSNFTRGMPIWAVSLGLLHNGWPRFGHVAVPTLATAFHGWHGGDGDETPGGAFRNGEPIRTSRAEPSNHQFFNICSRSLRVLKPGFPCKVRMLGSATYNLLTVAMGASLGGVEATPKVWDLAGIWPILHAAGAAWVPLGETPPFPLVPGRDYTSLSQPTLVVAREELVPLFRSLVAPVARGELS